MKATPLFLPLMAACFSLLGPGFDARAVTLGMVDDFETDLGTWGGGGGVAGSSNNVLVTTGGPAGAGDGYMQLSAEGKPIGSKDEENWTGNYFNAGITAISMDVNNFGPVAIDFRVFISDAAFDAAVQWTSTTAITIAPKSGWQNIVFNLTNEDMTLVNGPDSAPFNDIDWILGRDFSPSPVSDVGRLLIRHDPGTPDALGTNPGGDLGAIGSPHLMGIDNITATVIPEPAQGLLLLVGALGTALVRRRRR